MMTLEEYKKTLETKKKQAMLDLKAKEIECNRYAGTKDCSTLANEITELKGTIMAYTDAIVLLSYVGEVTIMDNEKYYLDVELKTLDERRKALQKAKKELLIKDKYHYVLIDSKKRLSHADHYIKSYDTPNFRTSMYFYVNRCDGIDFYDNKGNLIYQYRSPLTDCSERNYIYNRDSEAKAIQQLLLTKLKETEKCTKK